MLPQTTIHYYEGQLVSTFVGRVAWQPPHDVTQARFRTIECGLYLPALNEGSSSGRIFSLLVPGSES